MKSFRRTFMSLLFISFILAGNSNAAVPRHKPTSEQLQHELKTCLETLTQEPTNTTSDTDKQLQQQPGYLAATYNATRDFVTSYYDALYWWTSGSNKEETQQQEGPQQPDTQSQLDVQPQQTASSQTLAEAAAALAAATPEQRAKKQAAAQQLLAKRLADANARKKATTDKAFAELERKRAAKKADDYEKELQDAVKVYGRRFGEEKAQKIRRTIEVLNNPNTWNVINYKNGITVESFDPNNPQHLANKELAVEILYIFQIAYNVLEEIMKTEATPYLLPKLLIQALQKNVAHCSDTQLQGKILTLETYYQIKTLGYK